MFLNVSTNMKVLHVLSSENILTADSISTRITDEYAIKLDRNTIRSAIEYLIRKALIRVVTKPFIGSNSYAITDNGRMCYSSIKNQVETILMNVLYEGPIL